MKQPEFERLLPDPVGLETAVCTYDRDCTRCELKTRISLAICLVLCIQRESLDCSVAVPAKGRV